MNSTRKKRRLNPTVNSENEEEVIYPNVFYPSFKVHCDFCEKDITRHTKLVDANGLDTDMCVNCFLEGRQNEKHSKNNPYHVINRLTFPLYEDHWTAEEELLLIEGLEKFGFGNWVDIAEHLATDKTPEDVMNHYEKIYMGGKNFLPPTEMLTKRDNKHHLIIKQSASKAGRFNEDGDTKRKKYTKQYVEKKDTSANTATGNNNASQQPVGSLMQPKDSNVNTSEIVGFMPLRGDFDYEYDNEAELFLAEMEFNDDDKPEEIATKMKILEIYNIRLDERIKRKNFVIERDMLDLKKQNLLDRIRTKEEKEIYNLLKVFARFNTPEEHEKLVQGIYKERMLKKKIEELRFYKKIGLKTFEEVDLYIQEKKKKEEALQKKQKQNEVPLYDKQTKPSTVRRNRGNTDLKEANEKKNKYAQTQLNEKEMNLCDHVCITPHEFLLIKDLLVRECLKEGYLTRDFVDASIKLDFKDKANQVFDFLVTNKVISEKN